MEKLLSIKDLRDLGILHEANRLFFHPLGLALSVTIDSDDDLNGPVTLSIIDSRDDPEGFIYGKLNQDKIKKFEQFQQEKFKTRKNKLGYIVQDKD